MFSNVEVANHPAFYLLIAASILLSLGYLWGSRRNKRIFLNAFDALITVFRPKDQQFTNIGGLSGYHANLVPHRNKYIRRIDATITLLARQSWLYFPISRLTRKFDRLFMIFFLSPQATGLLTEGHIIEKQYSRIRGAHIEHEDRLDRYTFAWGGHSFTLYYEDERVKTELEHCIQMLGEPLTLRHIALVPERERMYVFMVPRQRSVERVVSVLHDWFTQTIDRRITDRIKS